MTDRTFRRRALAGGICLSLGCGVAAVAAAPSAHAAGTVTHYSGSLPDGATWIADVPSNWKGTLVLYSHGFGNLDAADAPNAAAQTALLNAGYALVGSSYSGKSLWALASAKNDQFAALAAIEKKIPKPKTTLAFGTSMGGLISAQEAQDADGRIDGTLTTCGLVGGGVNLNNYQLDGEYAISQLLAPSERIQLVNYVNSGQTTKAINQLSAAVSSAQSTAAGHARIALAAALLNTPDWLTGTTPPKSHDYLGQEQQEAAWLPQQLAFVIGARPSIESAVGGNASWNVGVNYGKLISESAFYQQVSSLYRQAGLSLAKDTWNLTTHTKIKPDVAALRKLQATSTVSGHLQVPELNMHTISDQLSPIAYENWYRKQVDRAGDGALLRQSYVAAVGHCNFSSSELLAGLQSVQQRVKTGRWGNTSAASLNKAAAATGLGASAFVDFAPPTFVNARKYWF